MRYVGQTRTLCYTKLALSKGEGGEFLGFASWLPAPRRGDLGAVHDVRTTRCHSKRQVSTQSTTCIISYTYPSSTQCRVWSSVSSSSLQGESKKFDCKSKTNWGVVGIASEEEVSFAINFSNRQTTKLQISNFECTSTSFCFINFAML